jgi:hypothetical protein
MKYEVLQEGIFLWVYKLKQPYSEIMAMPYHKAKKFMDMYMKYQDDLIKGLKSAVKKR